MRVTNHLATERAIRAITESREHLDAALERATSGRRISTASDDPAAALGIMQNESQLRARAQHRRNIGTANARVTMTDSTLDRMSSLLTRAKELAVSQASDTATDVTRRSTAAEANQLLADAVQLAAARFGDEYLFGGHQTATRPFTLDASGAAYTFAVAVPPPTGARAIEISSGQLMVTGPDGITAFGDDTGGPLAALQALAAALAGGDRAAVTASITDVDGAMDHVQQLVAETGARANQLQAADATHALLAIDLEATISGLRDIDVETAITELTSRQTAYQAAMAATARISGLSLADYLR